MLLSWASIIVEGPSAITQKVRKVIFRNVFLLAVRQLCDEGGGVTDVSKIGERVNVARCGVNVIAMQIRASFLGNPVAHSNDLAGPRLSSNITRLSKLML